ncbi:LOW QUALITY PROTEIN: mediator of RNA polymerase II transcription subunit 1.1 [Clupea harengus]|uniref:LOW QUALITY PROTEIN: mediator of RNA polymerase II transcription subunit 1.1 n=1 Tax=Clupea harengus TaxID=7950 RepID=A0A6P8F4P1_CLUHA|nr:LOW QUALITY PROTEIN: mediator of RNA polymerase II transcription subunit 1.1 [Clupea harengus]
MGGKKSSCILLLAAFAAFLRLGSAEGDPLPPSLVDLVRDSPISSIEDLKKVLDTDSVEEESDNQTVNEIHPSEAHHRVPRSLIANAEPAQQAACKVRTEVLEVTRSMHDRTNAHFVLWPPCVEVQRCSGCCSNGRTHECVPVLTEIRQLQMMKITYVNMRPHIEKVIIPVEDHVRCGCQSLPSPHAPRTSTPRRLQPTPPPAPRLARKPAQPPPPPPRSQNKDDLHRHDVLKHNQRLHLEERDAQDRVWQNKYSLSHTAGEPHHTPVRMDYQAQPQHPPTHTDHHHPPPPPQHPLTHTQPGASPADGEGGLSGQPTSGAQQALGNAGQQEDGRQPTLHHSSGDDNTRQTQGGTQQQQHQQQQHQQPNYKQYHHQYPQHNYRLTVEEQQRYQPTQSGTYMLRDATTPQQPQRGAAYHHGQPDAPVHHRGQPDAPAHHHRQSDMASHPHSQSEGSSHHSGSEGSSSPFDSQPEVTNGPRTQEDTEEEKRRRRLHIEELEKEKETQQDVKSVLHQDKHHSHQPQPQSQPQTSTQRAVTDAPTTLQPPSESPRPHTTPRPPPPRRRRRKHRRRLSKATMRAMIMVMS